MKPIILLIGKSCGGKTTLANELEKYYGLKYIKGCATEQEIDEADLYIINIEEVERFHRTYKGCKQSVTYYLDTPWYIRLVRMLKKEGGLFATIKHMFIDRKKFKNCIYDYKSELCGVQDNINFIMSIYSAYGNDVYL